MRFSSRQSLFRILIAATFFGSRLLKGLLLTLSNRSNFLPRTTLCIEKHKSVWVLYVDATCVNYDGNVFDASLLAMVAALKNSKCILY